MGTNSVILQGGGEHARVVLDCLLSQNTKVLALFDPKYTGNLFGIPQLGVYNPDFASDAKAIVAIGDNIIRKRVAGRTQHTFTNVIHSSAIVSPFVKMGVGNMVLQGVIIQAQTQIGDHVIINTGAQVDHDCVVNNYAHIAPGVILCGTVTVGEGSFVGAGAIIIPGKKIGAWATIGAGAVIIEDVPDYAVVVGNPGRVVKIKKPSFD